MSPQPDSFLFREQKIAYYTAGTGEPLILLHGWGSRSEWMFSLADTLSEVRTLIFLDFPGFGASEPLKESWMLDDYRSLVLHFLTEVLQIPRADFLVHSFGCRVLLPMLADKKDQNYIGKVIITGGAGLKPKRSVQYYAKSWFVKLLKAPYALLPAPARERGLARLRSSNLWKRLGSSDYRQLSGPMRETFVQTVTHHLDKLLPDIRHDILLLWGERDDATPLWMGEAMEEKIRGAALVTIKNAGHYAFLDQPQQFQAIVRAYLLA